MSTGIKKLESPIALIGRLISERRLNYGVLAGDCNRYLKETYPTQVFPVITEERIKKIMSAYRNLEEKGDKNIYLHPHETASLCNVLNIRPDLMFGFETTTIVGFMDIFTNPRYASDVLRLFTAHQSSAKEFFGWGDFIPCSLESQDFMEAHHANLFSRLAEHGIQDWRSLMQHYNTIGNNRRARLDDAPRTWSLHQLNYLSDLDRIARAEGDYKGISIEKRIRTFEHLIERLADKTSRIYMYVVDDVSKGKRGSHFPGRDTHIVMDDSFALWRDQCGNIFYTEDNRPIRQSRDMVDAFLKAAKTTGYHGNERVIECLRSLIAVAKESRWKRTGVGAR